MEVGWGRVGRVGGLFVVVMQVSVEDPDVFLRLVVDVVTVDVVVAAAGGHRLCSAADSAPAGGRLVADGAAVDGGSGGGSCLLPPAARDGELRSGAGAGSAVSALDGCLAAGAAAGPTDTRLQRKYHQVSGSHFRKDALKHLDVKLTGGH